jgi:MSHA biogenesis protein MshP
MYPNPGPNIKRQRGIGLIASIFLLVIMSLVVVALSNYTETSSRAFGQDLNSQRAFYAAEAGIEIALHRLSLNSESCVASLGDVDFSNLSSSDDDGLENCSVSLECNAVTVMTLETWRIAAHARCGYGFEEAQRSIQVQARDL